MPKQEDPQTYSCLQPRSNLRRAYHPHDEHPVVAPSRIRRALTKLAGAVHR